MKVPADEGIHPVRARVEMCGPFLVSSFSRPFRPTSEETAEQRANSDQDHSNHPAG